MEKISEPEDEAIDPLIRMYGGNALCYYFPYALNHNN